jgi:hypothetical protein
MNGRKEKLVHAVILVHCVTGFGLEPADDPVTALLGFLERIYASCHDGQIIVIENDFNAGL